MKKWRVEVEVIGIDEEDALDHLNLHPGDAVITELPSKLEAGWYQISDGINHPVCYFTDQQLEIYPFLDELQRMEEPRLYGESRLAHRIGTVLTEDEFDTLPNGSAIVDKDGDEWIRVCGRWTHPVYGWTPYYHDYPPYTVTSVG